MPDSPLPSATELARLLALEPLPLEGGLHRRTWAGPERPDGHPAGSAILLLLSREHGHFSALHRLPRDEVWHFYLGDPVRLLLLPGDTPACRAAAPPPTHTPADAPRTVVLGHDLLAGQHVQYTVPGGTWMGAEVLPGGSHALLGCTMAPGFTPDDYTGADPGPLGERHPEHAALIHALCRPGTPTRHPAQNTRPAGDGR
ncbi:cupin domain-containing protein [Streptomyces sp. URMC 123]|uniref:cupin domain-containing protein n=1 Tax=Streptomyces sp. URMC 123 TaxID=3423403 RepID=UPI003F1CAA2C